LDLSEILGSDLVTGGQSGLRGLAFHPDFDVPGAAGFGKLYTSVTLTVGSAADNPDTPLFASPGRDSHHDAIVEWRIDPTDPHRVDPASARELLRIEQPLADHNIGAIDFDPNAAARSPDFGLLYAGIGDGGLGVEQPNGQDTGNLLGSVIRIDPLQDGSRPYTVPESNPFVGDPDVLPEIWAFGLRHPQFLSWDQGGNGQMLIADIGEADLEEVSIVRLHLSGGAIRP
jgi:glucose/arabinose dehydrogenase